MKLLIITTDITYQDSKVLNKVLYKKYNHLGISSNSFYKKYIFIDEKTKQIKTFNHLNEFLPLNNVSILTHLQWLGSVI